LSNLHAPKPFSIVSWKKSRTYTYTNLSIDNVFVGGWKINKGSIAYTGSMTWRDGKTIKKDVGENAFGEPIWNNGLVGDGRTPSGIELVSPANLETINATQNPVPVTFTWTQHTNPWNNPVEYQLQVSNSIDFTSNIIDITTTATTATTSLNTSITLPKYYWRIRGIDSNGSGAWTSTWQLNIVQPPLPAPTLLLPSDLATINPDFSFSWNSVTDATEYYAEYSGTSSGNSGWISGTTFPVTSLPAGAYTWHVKARNAGGESPWSATWNFNVLPNPPVAPTLVSPADLATTSPDFSFSWNSAAGTTEYYAEYSGTSSGNSGWISGTTFPVTSMPVGTYTWHVKARNAGGESPWSTTWAFTVQIPAPPAPILDSPFDNTTTSPDVTLTWNASIGAAEYYSEYAGSSSGNSGWISSVNFPVTSLPVGIYTWHVKARNAGGESAWSTTWTFTVQPVIIPPVAPTLVSPADTATVGTDFSFSWNSDANATEYYAEYSGTSSGNSGWISDAIFSVTSMPVGTYTWHVKARNSAGEGPWSQTWNLTVLPDPPIAPTLISPADLATIGPDFSFSWNSVIGATEYYAEYFGASSGNSGWISGTTFPITSLPVGTYTWHVKARNAGGESAWSTTWTFTVQPVIVPPLAPTLVSPADNATVIGTGVTFTWNSVANATEYYAEYSGASSGNSGWISGTTFTVTSMSAGTYTWQVKARNAGGESTWSLTRTVILQVPPAQIQINSPTTLYPTFTTTNCPTSNWMRSTNNLGHYYYLTQNNNINPWVANPNYGYWKGTIPVAGNYKIEFYVPSHGTFYWCGPGGKAISTNTNDAHYQIYTSGSTWTKAEKSQSGGNVWVNLGNFYLTAGNYNVVKLIDSNHQTSFSQLIFFSDIRITWVSQ
jgi:hypothetical protein